MNSTSTITYELLLNWQTGLINQLSTQTIEYISLAVTFILATGGFFSYFTNKNLAKDIKKQEAELVNVKKELQTEIRSELTKSRDEISELTSIIMKDIEVKLTEAETNILKKTQDSNALVLAKVQEEISKAVIEINQKISTVEISQANNIKDVKTVTASIDLIKNDVNSLEIEIGVLKIYKYSKEGQMGAILEPLSMINKLIGTSAAWRIPDLLNSIKEHVQKYSPLDTSTQVKVSETFAKLPSKFDIPKEEILSIIRKDS